MVWFYGVTHCGSNQTRQGPGSLSQARSTSHQGSLSLATLIIRGAHGRGEGTRSPRRKGTLLGVVGVGRTDNMRRPLTNTLTITMHARSLSMTWKEEGSVTLRVGRKDLGLGGQEDWLSGGGLTLSRSNNQQGFSHEVLKGCKISFSWLQGGDSSGWRKSEKLNYVNMQ